MSSGRILLVDDSADDATFVRLAFQKAMLKHELSVVSSGAEAIAYLLGEGQYADRCRHPFPALMLLDLRMPTMDGFEVIRWVRGHEAVNRLPIAVLTGLEFPEDRKRAYALGANTFLVKPIRLDDFFLMIKAVMHFWLNCCQLPETSVSN